MTDDDVMEILDRLATRGIEAWLDGGWGIDALLGEQTRSHKDVDLVLRASDAAAMRSAMAEQGFVRIEGGTESNFVLRDQRGREIDVHTVRFDAGGSGVYRMENGEDWIYPADGFSGRGRVAGREVRCLTPEIQMLGHATGYEPGETDFHDMGLLHERLGTPLLGPFRRTGTGTGS